eukprot:Amastigsp_a21_4984.p2 type:complete len:164 gc:universal Amastigsp_a21_4984:543-52(-)
MGNTSLYEEKTHNMQIFVKACAGACHAINFTEGSSLEVLSAQITDVTGVPAEEQVLLCDGHMLTSTEALSSGATVYMSLSLLAAGKKRKKKTYSTPKKIPHKHQKVKLRVLSYYQVDNNGKITRLRRECPSAECGASTYMAKHADRQTCGRCGLTFRAETAEE